MRRASSQSSPSKNASKLLSNVNAASLGNSRARNHLEDLHAKVESARRHLAQHQQQALDESYGGESVENRSPHHRSRSTGHRRPSGGRPSNEDALHVLADTAVRARSRERSTGRKSVLYPGDLQNVRRMCEKLRAKEPRKLLNKDGSLVKRSSSTSKSPQKQVQPTRSRPLEPLPDFTDTPPRRDTYVVSHRKSNYSFSDSFNDDAAFRQDAADRRMRAAVDDRDYRTSATDRSPRREQDTVVSGLLSNHLPRSTHSGYHARCVPQGHRESDNRPLNTGPWEIEFLPGSLTNARKIEKDRRASGSFSAPNSDAIRYQEERTRREEEELRRLAREQMNGRTTKEIFDSWVPLDEERKRMKEMKKKDDEDDEGTERNKEKRKNPSSSRRLWEEEGVRDGDEHMMRMNGNDVLHGLDRMDTTVDEHRQRQGGTRRRVEEDEAGYAVPLPREAPEVDLRTPSPQRSRHTPDEEYFTPSATVTRPSRVYGSADRRPTVSPEVSRTFLMDPHGSATKSAKRRAAGADADKSGSANQGETPILGRHTASPSSNTFLLEPRGSPHRRRGDADVTADRSAGSSLYPTPDRRDQSIIGGVMGDERNGYSTPTNRRRVDEELIHLSGERSRILNESMTSFERNINRSMEQLSGLSQRLSSQLEQSKANLSALAANSSMTTTPSRPSRFDSNVDDILRSLPPIDERHSLATTTIPQREQNTSEPRPSLPSVLQQLNEEDMDEGRSREMPIPSPRTTVALKKTIEAVAVAAKQNGDGMTRGEALSSLLDAHVGRIERSHVLEQEADRLARDIQQVQNVQRAAAERQSLPERVDRGADARPLSPSTTVSHGLATVPSLSTVPHAAATVPRPQLSIATGGGRDELVEMYESRHRGWHRRGDDLPLPSPRSASSRSPSPLPAAFPDPAELRERQSKHGMLEQRKSLVRGRFLHQLQNLYQTRYANKYNELSKTAREAFMKQQKVQFQREVAAAKARAADPNIRYRDFMSWLKEESTRIEDEIEFEEMKKMRKTGGDGIPSTSRLVERERVLDERAARAIRMIDAAKKLEDKRTAVRALERNARRMIASTEAPSSGRSSIGGDSSLLNPPASGRRYSMTVGEPLRVLSRESSLVHSGGRDVQGQSMASATGEPGTPRRAVGALLPELKQKLEQRRRDADYMRSAMERSTAALNEHQASSIAAQISAHDDYMRKAAELGQIISNTVEPQSDRDVSPPPGVDRLDLSLLEEEEQNVPEAMIGMKMAEQKSSSMSSDSMDLRSSSMSSSTVPEVPPTVSLQQHPSTIPSVPVKTSSSSTSSTSGSSSSSSSKTLVEEDVVELDRSLPSTTRSSGRQEITVDELVVSHGIPEPTVEVTVAESGKESPVAEDVLAVTEHVHVEQRNENTVEDTVTKDTVVDEPISPLGTTDDSGSVSSGRSAEGGILPLDAVAKDTVVSTVADDEKEGTVMDDTVVSPVLDEKKDTVASVDYPSVVEILSSSDGLASSSSSTTTSDDSRRKDEALSNASLRKMSFVSEMNNTFVSVESDNDEDEDALRTPRPSTPPASTLEDSVTASSQVTTIIERSKLATRTPSLGAVGKQQEQEEEEAVVPDWEGDANDGSSARSTDFDWGNSFEQPNPKKEQEQRGDETIDDVLPVISVPEESKKEEEEAETPRAMGKFASLRERLARIGNNDVEEKVEEPVEKKDDENEQQQQLPEASARSQKSSATSDSTTTTTTSSSSTSSSSTSTSSSSSTTTSSSKASASVKSGESIPEEVEEQIQKTPDISAPSSTRGASSASGSVNFDDVADLPVSDESARTPRVQPRRFRLSLDDSLPLGVGSPRDVSSSTKEGGHNGRVPVGVASPRSTTPRSPSTPSRGSHTLLFSPNTSSIMSPSETSMRRNRFMGVMPLSPRSGRRSVSPKGGEPSSSRLSLSRDASFLLDDSSLADVSRLSAVEIPQPTSYTGFLPPLVSPSTATPTVPPRPSFPFETSQDGSSSFSNGDEELLDESVSFLMDVKGPVSILSSLPIGELLNDQSDEDRRRRLMQDTDRPDDGVESPFTISARSEISTPYDLLSTKEFIQPVINRMVDNIWEFIQDQGFYEIPDDVYDIDVDPKTGEATPANEKIALVRGSVAELAARMYPRDARLLRDGRVLPKQIVPLRQRPREMSKDVLLREAEKELFPSLAEVPGFVRRLRSLGIDYDSQPIELKIFYQELYADELTMLNSDVERAEIVQIILDNY